MPEQPVIKNSLGPDKKFDVFFKLEGFGWAPSRHNPIEHYELKSVLFWLTDNLPSRISDMRVLGMKVEESEA